MPIPDDNVKTMETFFAMAFDQGRPEEAVAACVGDVYIQHTPFLASGKEPFIEGSKNLEKLFGEVRSDRKLVIATEEYVVALSHVVPLDGSNPGLALVDILRFDENGKIVEHWDVTQNVPEADQFKHSNGMF